MIPGGKIRFLPDVEIEHPVITEKLDGCPFCKAGHQPKSFKGFYDVEVRRMIYPNGEEKTFEPKQAYLTVSPQLFQKLKELSHDQS